jgi:hypothetical protein
VGVRGARGEGGVEGERGRTGLGMLEVTTGKVMTSFLYPKYAPMNTSGTEIPNLRGGRRE